MLTRQSTTEYLGVEFANLSQGEVVIELDWLSKCDSFAYVVTPNVDHLVMLHEGQDEGVRERFNEAYKAAALRICDSRILQLLAKFRGISLEVVTGSDLTAHLFESGHLDGKKVAIVGGDEATLPELHARFPNIDLVQQIPPMGVLKNQLAADEIEAFIAANPCHYVLLAIGAPQSEIVAAQCLKAGRSRGVGLCVGASIEFVLGRKARAPLWMQAARLEWVFRLLQEPSRLSKRYLIEGPRILRIMLTHKSKPGSVK